MRSFTFSVLLLTSDHELHETIQRTLKDLTLTVARDVTSIPRAAMKQGFDAVLIEARRGARNDRLSRSTHYPTFSLRAG